MLETVLMVVCSDKNAMKKAVFEIVLVVFVGCGGSS